MPLIKANEIMPERPVILVLYGTPGAGKTSLATTAEKPLLIDTDRGYDRAVQRIDTLTASCWEDIFNTDVVGSTVVKDGRQVWKPGILANYKTIIIDTAKAMLDDYLSSYAIKQDYKLANNSLKRYGKIGELFKDFVNILQTNGTDLVFICHDKESVEGDIIKHSPDCTGQSKDLLIRKADQVGYVTVENGSRVVKFEPSDTRVGKNVARLDDLRFPDFGSAEFPTFMADIVTSVKNSIQMRSEAQVKALEGLNAARARLDAVSSIEEANAMIELSNSLAKIHQKGFKNLLLTRLKEKGFVYDPKKKSFIYEADSKGDAD